MELSRVASPLDSLSLTRLRERRLRFVFVGLSLISFAALYVTPLVSALHLPAKAQPTTPLPSLAVPQVAFPSLGVPKLRAVRAGAPPPIAPEPRRAAVPTQVPQAPVAPARRESRPASQQVPVVDNTYSLTPETATAGGQGSAKDAKDPFANVPVVDNTIGGTPPPSQAADVVPEPSRAATPLPTVPAASEAEPTTPAVESAESTSAPLEGYRLTRSVGSDSSQQRRRRERRVEPSRVDRCRRRISGRDERRGGVVCAGNGDRG